MQQLLSDITNGNLSDAKRRARRLPYYSLVFRLQEEGGQTLPEAMLCANWLKGRGSWQDYCDYVAGRKDVSQ